MAVHINECTSSKTPNRLNQDGHEMNTKEPYAIYGYIYTPSVFCYDKHNKNFDIQFSMKRHETV